MRAIFIIAAILLSGAGLLWHTTEGARAVTSEGARRVRALAAERRIPDIGYEDMSGETVRIRGPAGGVALVEFIYTRCPTICQSAGETFARLRDRLKEEGLIQNARLFSISFDPIHDDRTALTGYAEAHGADGAFWAVAAPAPRDLRNVLEAFGIVIVRDKFGGFEHNAAVHLVDSRDRLAGIFDIDDIDAIVGAVRDQR